MNKRTVNVEFGKCSFIKEEELRYSLRREETSLPSNIRPGQLYFGEHEEGGKHIPFMFCPYTIDAKEIVDRIFQDWKLSVPRIILFAYTETEDFPSDGYRQTSQKLVEGLLHVLNTTEMWLCTDGLNNGFSRDIGEVFGNETEIRKTMESSLKNISTAFPDTTLIGICRKDMLNFSYKFDEAIKQEIESEEPELPELKRNINSKHDCFIIVDDATERKTGILQFLHNFALQLRTHQTKLKSGDTSPKVKTNKIPLIALLLQGKITQIDLILWHLKEGIPLVIFEGSGGLADILAFAYSQVLCRPDGSSLPDYTEAVLKPAISDKIHEFYPELTSHDLSFLIQKIFACLRYSTYQDQELITVLNLNYFEFDSSQLPSFLLRALFKSKISDSSKDIHQKKRDLLLAMDWNSPDIAREEVFARASHFQIDNEMFFRALTESMREDFVSVFLDQGFLIHRFLDSVSLTYLFQNSLKKEFFRGVIWENILGFGTNVEFSRSFLDGKLIMLIEEFTGIPSLINSYELDWNHRAIYDDRTPQEAERKAMIVLTFWAILSYRIQLAKTLWKHSEQPIQLALACSILLKKLSAFVTDMSLKNELEKESKVFSEMAVDVMTICYENVPCRALDLLNEKNRVWSFKTLLELAAFTKNKMFLSHPSCQKKLDNIFLGCIKIRDLPYGDLTVPLWLKIILSAFLVFPVFMWVRFDLPGRFKSTKNGLSLENAPSEASISPSSEDITSSSSARKKKNPNINFFLKLYYFWSAPITKFWVWQVFYVLFLFCFSLAVIWPACGNVFLDFFTCIWIAILILDSIYHAYTLNIKYTSMPLVYKCLEISLMILFLFGYALGRIIWKHKFMTPYQAKVMLCVALLYCYYRVIFIALPISAELGPMLYRVKRMVAVDFENYMRVTILVMISNGLVIHAIIYPDYPLNWELVRRAFYDSIISLFLTPAGHYGNPNPSCIRLKRGINKLSFVGYPQNECKVGRYLKYDCPNPGVWPYIFGLQYFILLRLILGVMLYALFSNTTRKLEEEGKYIWKYQRYELVINFSNRLTLPPPLCIITLTYIFLRYVWKHLLKCKDMCFNKKPHVKSYKSHSEEFRDELDNTDFRYWKSLAMKYYIRKQRERTSEMTTKKRMEQVNSLSGALNEQRKTLRDLEGNLNELQIQIANTRQSIEESGFQVSKKEKLVAKNVPQIISRISPYPNTRISRFPVSDIHVPWKCIWTMYDPISFTLPKEKYPASLKPYVDVDIQKHREVQGEAFKMPNFSWNQISLSPGGVSVDRQSWIADKSKQYFEYEIDSEGLPRNPLGRTGLKGRGSLLRWGPNHYIYVLITRWHVADEMYDKYLDIVLLETNGDLSLPGGYVHTENRYETIKSLFECETNWFDSEDMIAFFDSLKGVPEPRKNLGTEDEQNSTEDENSVEDMVPLPSSDFTSERVKLGYLDEETNTDQAWCEAEIWHFHYEGPSVIKEKFKANMNWYLLEEHRLMEVPTGQAAIMHTTAKKMKAYLETPTRFNGLEAR